MNGAEACREEKLPNVVYIGTILNIYDDISSLASLEGDEQGLSHPSSLLASFAFSMRKSLRLLSQGARKTTSASKSTWCSVQWMELFILCLLQHKLLLDIFIVIIPPLYSLITQQFSLLSFFSSSKKCESLSLAGFRKIIKNSVKEENEISAFLLSRPTTLAGHESLMAAFMYALVFNFPDKISQKKKAKRKEDQFNNLLIWGMKRGTEKEAKWMEKFLILFSHLIQFDVVSLAELLPMLFVFISISIRLRDESDVKE